MTELLIGIPSKGRLQENTAAFFARAGLGIARDGGDRNYRGRLNGLADVEVLFLSASEIALELSRGGLHLGVTGEDLLREEIADADQSLAMLTPLGFGEANVVVAVPQAWIDVSTMDDLEDVAAEIHLRHGRRMRIATKYVHLTRRFFAEHSISDYRIVESLGATEGAPASGAAEAIVDITTTGATLAANGLKLLEDGTILRSQANLVASLRADWNEQAKASAKTVLGRIQAEERARQQRELRASALPDLEESIRFVENNFGAQAPHGYGEPLVLHVPEKLAARCADELIARGATAVSVAAVDYLFTETNTLFDALLARLA
jgi:ATP phosphoribosyltransferase